MRRVTSSGIILSPLVEYPVVLGFVERPLHVYLSEPLRVLKNICEGHISASPRVKKYTAMLILSLRDAHASED